MGEKSTSGLSRTRRPPLPCAATPHASVTGAAARRQQPCLSCLQTSQTARLHHAAPVPQNAGQSDQAQAMTGELHPGKTQPQPLLVPHVTKNVDMHTRPPKLRAKHRPKSAANSKDNTNFLIAAFAPHAGLIALWQPVNGFSEAGHHRCQPLAPCLPLSAGHTATDPNGVKTPIPTPHTITQCAPVLNCALLPYQSGTAGTCHDSWQKPPTYCHMMHPALIS